MMVVPEGLRTAGSLSRWECLSLLATREMGRVAISRGALPAILPVTYSMSGEDIVFATGLDGQPSAVMDGHVIAFEVDDLEAADRSGWSVLVVGMARCVDAGRDPRSIGGVSPEHWSGSRPLSWMRLSTERISGRRRPAVVAL